MTSIHQFPTQFSSLNEDQKSLLLNALSSNKITNSGTTGQASRDLTGVDDQNVGPMAAGVINPSMLDNFNTSPMEDGAMPVFTDDPVPFDFDFPEEGRDQINSSKDADGQTDYFNGEHGEKRKSPDEDDSDESDDEHKRQEGEDKISKKPGRKPLTSEPTTKRKAQNRAAQRAFRERKEKHLKDLEQKVEDLEKASESANHENSLLRAQVSRLQDQLGEYRKRMSAGSTSSPPRNTYGSWQQQRSSSSGSLNAVDFNFDFPKFGGLPGTQLPGATASNGASNPSYAPTMSSSPGTTIFSRHASRSLSPGSNNNNNTVATSPSNFNDLANEALRSRSLGSDALDSMFSTDFLGGANSGFSNYTNNMSTQNKNNGNKAMSQAVNAPQSTTGSATSNAASPSASTMSHPGRSSSSSATSPEPYNQSPPDANKTSEQNGASTNGFDFGTLQTASNGAPKSPGYNLDWLSDNNLNFDPVLFGDYRDSQDAVIGSGEFSGGFFEDTFNLSDFDNPFSFNTSAANTVPAPMQQKPTLMEQVEKQKNGESSDYRNAGPGDEKKQLMTAHKIWNTLQNCPKFAAGDFDIDGLCSELQTKATCSESGVVVPKEDVEAALYRLGCSDSRYQFQKQTPPA